MTSLEVLSIRLVESKFGCGFIATIKTNNDAEKIGPITRKIDSVRVSQLVRVTDPPMVSGYFATR